MQLEKTLHHLRVLVACNTQNPPRTIGPDGIFSYLGNALPPGFRHEIVDLGDGCVSLLSIRGNPDVLFNVHVDTVPADPGWRSNPLQLEITDGNAVGLGAADIKGAAACLLTAVHQSDGDVALLFTSDEEAGTSKCVKHFLEHNARRWRGAVIAEPTNCRAVLAHRGIATCSGEFHGVAGHASAARALQDSALHEMLRWGQQALAHAEARESRRFGPLSGVRFNLGFVEGGTKPNMIASSARVRFGVRPLPDQDPLGVLQELQDLAADAERVQWQTGFVAPPLPASDASREFAASLGLPGDDAVDFWTEAALFNHAGIPSVVFGPGSIAQAHTAGEWVSLQQLEEATQVYVNIISRPKSAS